MKNLLDTLARWVCDSTEVCVSCCAYQNKVYWASNQKKIFRARESWEALFELINKRSELNYQKLFILTALKIKMLAKKQDFITVNKEKLTTQIFLQNLKIARGNPSSVLNWLEVQTSAESLFQEMLQATLLLKSK